MTTFASTAGSFTPLIVDGFSSERSGRSTVHQIIGATDPAVALQPAALRTGSLRCVFGTLPAAQAAEGYLKQAVSWVLTDTDQPGIGMSFVVTGVSVDLDDTTREAAVVTIGFQEVGT